MQIKEATYTMLVCTSIKEENARFQREENDNARAEEEENFNR